MPGPGVSGLSASALPVVAPVCRDCVWWQSRGNRTASSSAGSSVPRRSGAIGGRSTSTTTAACSGRCSTGRRTSSPARPTYPRGRLRRRRSRHLRLPASRGDRLGREVASPRRDRRVARPWGHRPGGVRLPLPGARDAGGAVPGPPDGVPARLPRRVRVRDAPLAGPRRALSARARRPSAGRGGRRAKVLRVVQDAFTPTRSRFRVGSLASSRRGRRPVGLARFAPRSSHRVTSAARRTSSRSSTHTRADMRGARHARPC